MTYDPKTDQHTYTSDERLAWLERRVEALEHMLGAASYSHRSRATGGAVDIVIPGRE